MTDLDYMMSEEEAIYKTLEPYQTLKQRVDLYWELLEQSEGEVTPMIEILSQLIQKKKEDTLSYIISKTYDYNGLINAKKEHIKALQASVKQLEGKTETLSNWADNILTRDGLSKYDCANGKISYRKSERVEVRDLECLDNKYIITKETKQADKKLLKEDLKLGSVNGAELVKYQNINIK